MVWFFGLIVQINLRKRERETVLGGCGVVDFFYLKFKLTIFGRIGNAYGGSVCKSYRRSISRSLFVFTHI